MTRDDLIAHLTSKVPMLVDRREDADRHDSKKWGRRQVFSAEEQDDKHVSAIQGIVIHQSAGSGGPDGINRYHIGANHISPTGAPRACYFIIIDKDGQAHVMNDLEDITWSQGGKVNPIPGTRANTNFLGICVVGNFDGPSYKGTARGPTPEQLRTLDRLIPALADLLGLDPIQTYGHYHFGKENCPGKRLQRWVEDRRKTGLKLPKTDREWQQALVDLGYDLGEYGPNKDGVDGSWGRMSRLALLQFQQGNRAQDTGMRDHMTAVELASAASALPVRADATGQCAS